MRRVRGQVWRSRSTPERLLAAVIFKSHADHAFVEGVGARPGEGAWVHSLSAGPGASSKAFLPPLASM